MVDLGAIFGWPWVDFASALGSTLGRCLVDLGGDLASTFGTTLNRLLIGLGSTINRPWVDPAPALKANLAAKHD